MAAKPLWDNAKNIMLEMRDLIQRGNTERVKESRFGWQYRLLDQCKAIKADMESQGYRVHDCTVFHFALAARIENPTKRLLLVPIKGIASLTPTESLSPNSYWDIKDADRVLTPDEISGADIMIITLDGGEGQEG
ncbi:uncharacterized protein N7515_010213 [Penicillium bovifimosum]|uniref:Uncharacterized protein n=1 Tax=Penicillium bovifimosum TaxID=126998 RepID=A0A9W9GI22_9EURO|nr:uncharacterized protein N7515_010213 [Penicillium bovifimosum]KAJ5120825.1 hypothetical protein N7515_010213 [Penicillium bovifimosum]